MVNPGLNIADLSKVLDRFRKQYRYSLGIDLAQRKLWIALVICLSTQIAGRLFPITNLWAFTLAPVVIWFIIIISASYLKPVSLMHVARHVDLNLGLRERVSTALALQETGMSFPIHLVRAQQANALATALTIEPGQAFPLRWRARPMAISGLLIIMIVGSILLPNPMDTILAQREAAREAAQQQATRIEELQRDLEKNEVLTPEDKEQLLRQLADLQKALEDNPGDWEQAMADINKIQQQLQARVDPNVSARQANLESLAAQLEKLTGSPRETDTDPAASALEALQSLAEQAAVMQPNDRQALVQQFAQLAAQASLSGNQQLGQALATLAQSLTQSPDNDELRSAQNAVQQALLQTQQELATQAILQSLQAQLQASQQALASSAAQASLSGQPNQSAGQSTSGNQPSSGNQPGSGGGSTSNSLPPGTFQGQAGRPQGDRPAPAPGSLDEQIFTPWQSSPLAGEELFIPGQDTGQGESQVISGQGQQPGISNPALVPYAQVYYQYATAANQALQQSYIPAQLKTYVEEYFSQLEPR